MTVHIMWYVTTNLLINALISVLNDNTLNLLQKENPMGRASEIEIAISEQIAHMCNCEYSESFIDDGQFFCSGSEKEIIYQAQLLTTDGKTADEIRNVTQKWVLTKPFITSSSNEHHQLDPYCSVVIQEIGDISCDPIVPTLLPSAVKPGIDSVAYSIGGMLLLLSAIGGMIIVAVILYKIKKARGSYSMRYAKCQTMTIMNCYSSIMSIFPFFRPQETIQTTVFNNPLYGDSTIASSLKADSKTDKV